jgi:predicted dienelactone hydrolase
MTRYLTLVLLAIILANPVGAETPDPAKLGPYELLDIEKSLQDRSRNRLVETRVTIPSGNGPFPLVIVSHGLGGNKESHRSIGRHIASHGYIVFTPEHPFSNTTGSQAALNAQKGGSLPKRTRAAMNSVGLDSRAVLGRPGDVSFLIDTAEQWNSTQGHPLFSRIDLQNVAVLGHSFGAYTVYSSCGARPILDHLKPTVPPGQGLAPSLRDPRVNVGVAYSPQGPGNGFYSEESFGEMTCPMLILSGSRDSGANFLGGGLPAKNRYRSFELMPEGDKYYLWLWNAGHMAWADFDSNSDFIRGGAKWAVPENEDVLRISKVMTLIFLNTYLKKDEDSRRLLTEDYAKTLTGRVIKSLKWAEK